MSGEPAATADGAPRRRFGRRYGASPWHLLAVLAGLLLSAYVVSRLADNPSLLRIAVWFVGAAIVWDLVGGPLIALVDRLLLPLRSRPRRVSLLNHVRVPALLSGLLLIVWTPLIFQRSEQIFRLKAGLTQNPYLDRWLVITAVLVALSALVYAVRLARAGRAG
jgi:hypothetical protein